ncbi:uncharacterized protein MEPE_03396 [Melanopsichium pennsylvanicum]|uniref:Uncharacterized protein n=1 Tax=Melanopsichium pennsylvanicum TaxID=63383 RepID=A0AAJ4XMR0_9BASI|nr:uncharacterized protein MEPE_03396 [Melanopsichium pennsylvanicum]
MDSPADNPSADISTVPPPSPTSATAAASAAAAAATTTTTTTTTTTMPASGDRPSETSAGPIRRVRCSPRAHLSRGANSGRHEHAVRQQSADPSVNPSSTTSLVLAPRNSMPWSRPSVPIEITPELVGDDLAPLWGETWGDCYACVCAGVACERAGGNLRCRRCQGQHGQPCDADMRDPGGGGGIEGGGGSGGRGGSGAGGGSQAS